MLDRRRFLNLGVAASAGMSLPALATPGAADRLGVFIADQAQQDAQAIQESNTLEAIQPQEFWNLPRELWLYRAATKENVRLIYWQDGRINPEGYRTACMLLRDTHENKAVQMDVALLDVLRGVYGYYEQNGWRRPIVVNSGYRTPRTNAKLKGEGAAMNSMHLYGRASDIWLPDIPVNDVGNLARYLQQGGVGYYPNKNFVHVDTGRIRVWGRRTTA